MKQIFTLLLLLFIICPALPVFGLTEAEYQHMKSMESFTVIKSQVAGLLQENAKLVQQHAFLENEYYKIYKKVDEVKKDIDGMLSFSWNAIEQKKDRSGREQELKEEFRQLQNEILVKKTRNSSLKGLNIDTGDSKRLWDLQKKEQGYKIRELEMEVELKERLFKNKSEKYTKEIDELEKNMQIKKDSVANTESELAEYEKLVNDAPGKIASLGKELKALEKAVVDLRIEKDILSKKNIIAEKKKKIDALSSESEIKNKQMKRYKLEQFVYVFKKEYAELDKKLKELLSFQDRNKKILDLIKEYDADNQGLRKKISELKENID